MSGLNEIIRDLASTYSAATPEEISDAVIREIEIAIPKVIKRLKMPEPASPTQARLARYRLLRTRGFRRSSMEKKQSAHERFQTEVYQLRHDLNGHEVSGTSTFSTRLWDTSTYDEPDPTMYDGQPLLKEKIGDQRIEGLDAITPRLDVVPLPYASFRQEDRQTMVKRFVVDEDFAKRLEDHPIYWRVAKSVEEATREFAEKTTTEWDFQLSAESDVEIPSWNRFILSMSIPVQDIDEKIKQWDLLDASIRQRIRQLADDYPENSAEILQFGKLLFLKMELA